MDVLTAHSGLGGMANALDLQKLAADTAAKTVGQADASGLPGPETVKTQGQTRLSAQAVTGVGGKLDVTV